MTVQVLFLDCHTWALWVGSRPALQIWGITLLGLFFTACWRRRFDSLCSRKLESDIAVSCCSAGFKRADPTFKGWLDQTKMGHLFDSNSQHRVFFDRTITTTQTFAGLEAMSAKNTTKMSALSMRQIQRERADQKHTNLWAKHVGWMLLRQDMSNLIPCFRVRWP